MLDYANSLASNPKNSTIESIDYTDSSQCSTSVGKSANHSPPTSKNKQIIFRSPSKVVKHKDKNSKLDRSIVKLSIEERFPSEESESESTSETADELIYNSMMNALRNRPTRTKEKASLRANTVLAIPKVQNIVEAKEPTDSQHKPRLTRNLRKRSLGNFTVKSIDLSDTSVTPEPPKLPIRTLTFNDYIFTSEHNRLGIRNHAYYKIKQGEYTLFCAKQKDRSIQVNSPIFISSGTKTKQTTNKHVGIFMAFNKITEFALADIQDNVQYSSEQIKANIQKDQLSLSLNIHTPRDKLEVQGNYSSTPADSNRTISFVDKVSNVEYIRLTANTESTWTIHAISDIDPKQLLSLAIVIDHFSRIAKKNSSFI
ncbi:hypothetical protein TVAG_473040 [Trichomonas vaginalis G3]|uniref:Uncharacterized protein n=1 Tax=Trichomonas vaginalis (strain ATCC PRA-98 / G3) TaxID=412133 RepID=A2ERV0_TRIV3|nr:hypothetical protein TVAGG3_0019990 [Trichomonas vaginalis G3]EAY04617.1 hypothetical protein TVAG_473040 [Trichomonas vaginalis G3]KAI5539620.1 hypothetical protein TVAGG3_0019990 [Trichomonas vaginalis G3]|eukprot:XP_001316840.1 hypothetical protein [Trichomonas vaginalis G3]